MKLRNKKTGEICEIKVTINGDLTVTNRNEIISIYSSLAELEREWEDYEEDKRYWYIDVDGEIMSKEMAWFNQSQDNIGNCFNTREEAEKAVEKLKAWKRLRDKGFRFGGWKNDSKKYLGDFVIFAHIKDLTDIVDDIDLLFRGEE